MSDKNMKLCRYVSGAVMILTVLNNILYGVEFESISDFANLIFCISSVLIAIALFTCNTQYFIVGCGVGAFSAILYVIGYIQDGYDIGTMLGDMTDAAFYVLIAMSLLSQKDSAKMLPIAIAVVIVGAFVSACQYVIPNEYYDFLEKFGYIFGRIRSTILFYLPILIGLFTLEHTGTVVPTYWTATIPVQNMPENSIEKITKLKELLDSGIISQEEFDAKKKQLLGL